MKFYAVLCWAVCLLSLLVSSQAQLGRAMERLPVASPPVTVFDVNLRNGVTSALPAGVTWHSSLTGNQEACTCDRQGVLKLTFGPSRVRAEINMTFEGSEGWTFNLGDSVTNNGYAGDGGTQSNDAEVHSLADAILFYGRDRAPPATGSHGLLLRRADFLGRPPYSRLTLHVSDGLTTADNGQDFLYVHSPHLFALQGQSDASPGGVNRDVYLAMNRVVGGAYRSGKGLCGVKVTFHPV
eukprot:TRINITY_DN37093_c0_g2_i1.p1 TRINITY_DN37093_c0_g2~~TRINITY_DN37093_c0_g2_i1.p1  ORF type:complete len:239 (+),score=41.65 TRINITY_DN37093_c0_g2_i1:61-777(+)